MKPTAAAVSALGVCCVVHLGVVAVIGAAIGWHAGVALGVAVAAVVASLMAWRVRDCGEGSVDAHRC